MIPVSSPLLTGNEKKYLSAAIDEGEVSSQGRFVQRFEEAFATWSGNAYAIAVSSGIGGLETAVRSVTMTTLSIQTGTIISCYTASIRAGASVFLRDNKTSTFMNGMRCHLFGETDNSSGNSIVDDLSQYWKPFKVKDVGCYSLYANKLITCGEGGVIVTNNRNVFDRARSYRNLCHSEERFIHNELGYNFRMSNLQAAVALAQLEQIEKFTAIKRRNRNLYLKHLPTGIICEFNVDVPWMYLITTPKDAGKIVKAMYAEGVECRRFFYPLHRQPCINIPAYFPIADDLWNHSFYLPSGLTLTEKEIVTVCKVLTKVLKDVR